MKGLEVKHQIEGKPGEEGSVCKVFFDMGKHKMEMIETITKKIG